MEIFSVPVVGQFFSADSLVGGERPCSKCGGGPTILPVQYGRAFYALCEQCGFEGGLREVEATPMAALSHWKNKNSISQTTTCAGSTWKGINQ